MGKNELDNLTNSNDQLSDGFKSLIINSNSSHDLQKLKVIEENAVDLMEIKKEVKAVELPEEMSFFDRQVGGHLNYAENLGMIKFKDKILKPMTNRDLYEREVKFYELVEKQRGDRSKCDFLCHAEGPLWKLVPQYFGQKTLKIDDRNLDYLILEDLTRGFKEPCIMDIKIGRQTWDPLASSEKIASQDSKYKETKSTLGICIPGFQVYDLKTGKLKKFGKEYGKQLNKYTIIEAFKTFLNAEKYLSRHLLVQLLVSLWSIQHWARRQTSFNLYASSILLIYDAKRLRLNLQKTQTTHQKIMQKQRSTTAITNNNNNRPQRTGSLYRPMSMATLNGHAVCTGFSGQFSEEGPVFPHKICKSIVEMSNGSVKKGGQSAKTSSLKRVHSFHHNYDEDLQCIRSDYANILEDLVTERESEEWATAKMIDFAHSFPKSGCNACKVDENYLHGVDSLVKILESFLADAQDA